MSSEVDMIAWSEQPPKDRPYRQRTLPLNYVQWHARFNGFSALHAQILVNLTVLTASGIAILLAVGPIFRRLLTHLDAVGQHRPRTAEGRPYHVPALSFLSREPCGFCREVFGHARLRGEAGKAEIDEGHDVIIRSQPEPLLNMQIISRVARAPEGC